VLQKRQKPAVEITVVFSDAFARNTANSNMSRYFYERKNTLEEKQRQEYGSVSGQTDPASRSPRRASPDLTRSSTAPPSRS